MIAPSLTLLAVMALHPTGQDAIHTASAGGSNALAQGVHLAAVTAQGTLLAGTLGLTLSLRRRRTIGAYVFYALAGAAAISALVASGFIAPGVLRGLDHADPAGRADMLKALDYTALLNQGFARVYAVCSGIAILLWSAAARDTNELPRGAALFGVLTGVIVPLAVATNHIRLNVHGFGVVVMAQSIWLIWTAVHLGRRAA